MDYCLYVSYHPLGNFYVGKGKTNLVSKGLYKGSGAELRRWFLHWPQVQWTCEIVQANLTEQEAYDLEATYIDRDLLADPKCLNQRGGGRTAAFYSPEARARISKAHTGKTQSLESNEKRSKTLAGRMTNPKSAEIAVAMGKKNLGLKRSAEVRAAKSASMLGKPRGPYNVQKGRPRTEKELAAYARQSERLAGKKRGPYKKRAKPSDLAL